MEYQQILNTMTGLPDENVIFCITTGAGIPNDPENVDWQAYQEWLAAGNTPLPPA